MVTKKTASPKTASAAAKDSKAAAKVSVRVIKKYPNRRLYDTETSAYITLAEVKRLVMKNERFVVVDVKTNDDLTRSILLQIILEEESGGAPMFTETILANIIRFYGNSMQGFMGSYLEKNVQTFTDLQSKMTEQTKMLSASSVDASHERSKPADARHDGYRDGADAKANRCDAECIWLEGEISYR